MIRFSLIFVCSFIFFNKVFAQKKYVLFAMDDINTPTKNILLKMKNVKECKVIYGDYINPKNSYNLNENLFEKEISRLFPNKYDRGYALIDWEGSAYHDLINNNISETNKIKACDEFLKAINIAKNLRPNVLFGFHAIPNPQQINYTALTKKYLFKILNESDIIVPLFYLESDNDKLTKRFQSLNDFISDNFKNKLILPIVWDRFSSSNPERRFKKMSNNLFNTYTSEILAKKRISGIIYWGRDTWFINVDKNPRVENSLENFKSGYNNRVISNIRRLLR